jgi:hypothetical protein
LSYASETKPPPDQKMTLAAADTTLVQWDRVEELSITRYKIAIESQEILMKNQPFYP